MSLKNLIERQNAEEEIFASTFVSFGQWWQVRDSKSKGGFGVALSKAEVGALKKVCRQLGGYSEKGIPVEERRVVEQEFIDVLFDRWPEIVQIVARDLGHKSYPSDPEWRYIAAHHSKVVAAIKGILLDDATEEDGWE